jgi:ribonuclease HI
MIDAKGRRKEIAGGEPNSTNNRMEITAALMGLRALKKPCSVTVTSDSQYVVKAFNDKWLDGWQKRGWKTASKEPVKNRDLWEELLKLVALHQVTWVWTRGHSGHPENERCDELCGIGRASLRGATGATWFEVDAT